MQNFVNGEPVYFDVHIFSEGAPDTMICDEMRWDYKEEDEFCYLYVGGTKSESIKSLKGTEYIEYKCPFEYSGEELTYTRDDSNLFEGYLYIKNHEWNEITRTCYTIKNKSLEEKTNGVVDKWELEVTGQDELEIVKSDSADLFELYIKGTRNKCEVYRWNDEFSNYFEAGKEWRGTGLWSIYDCIDKTMVVIGASLTD